MRILIFSIIFFAPAAQAVDFCADLQQLHGHIFFCEDNVTYAKYAEKCKEQFRAFAQAKSVALQKTLVADLAAAKGESQTTHFKTTQVSYESTDLALGQAIDTGRHARAEVVAYGDDFVAPFGWPWMDLGPWPGLHHAKVQELFRSQGCYKDNIEAIEHATAEFDQMIRDLETTRTVTASLHKRAGARELTLADLSGIPVIGAHAVMGNVANGASDVTGTNRAISPTLSSGSAVIKLRDPVFRGPAASAPASDITHSSSALLRASEATGLFKTSLESVSQSAKLEGKLNGVPKNVEPESVGSVLWGATGSDAKSGLSLKPVPLTPSDGSVDASGSILSGAVAREPASSAASSAVAGPERDLFALVRDRYRASELFRAPISKE